MSDLVAGDFGAADLIADLMEDRDDFWMNLLQEDAI